MIDPQKDPILVTVEFKRGNGISTMRHNCKEAMIENGFLKLLYASGSTQAYNVDAVVSYFYNPGPGKV